MPFTPVYGIPYPALSDPPNGPSQLQALATEVETELARIDGLIAGNASSITTLQNNRERILAWGRRTSSSSSTTTTVGVIRLDGIALTGGRLYRVTYVTHPSSTVGTDTIRTEVRFTTNNTAATTASPVMFNSQVYDTPNAETHMTLYAPSVNETLSVLLCVTRFAGSGNVLAFADSDRGTDITVEDLGTSVGDTGVDI